MEQKTKDYIAAQLQLRKEQNALRTLEINQGNLIDFCSNDYLGFAQNNTLKAAFLEKTKASQAPNGPAASRLISGHYKAHEQLENKIADFHTSASALLFNSGYDANLGLFSCVPQKGDTIIYDQLAHASIRDGIRMSNARSYSFKHNDIASLTQKLTAAKGNIFVAVEAVYSMDGDQAPLNEIANICKKYGALLIVDEAHSIGLYGKYGAGLCDALKISSDCFARVITYGKAMGTHGAAILGSIQLKQYLINFSRPFIYTTAMDHSSIFKIDLAYDYLIKSEDEQIALQQGIKQFKSLLKESALQLIASESPIQCVLIPGNNAVKQKSSMLRQAGFHCKAILSPTVPEGMERIRISLHAFNKTEDIEKLCSYLLK